jgi:hypothetical protein
MNKGPKLRSRGRNLDGCFWVRVASPASLSGPLLDRRGGVRQVFSAPALMKAGERQSVQRGAKAKSTRTVTMLALVPVITGGAAACVTMGGGATMRASSTIGGI